ncbi:hypothetical protein BDN70DRAFT_537432 [Pholiota conissans]|uniref:Protein-S-isoprenylcysteine O-methyltransferase n=1 Tax=Pholiota conissans TaxID=109636 RepID=A0A9P5ZDF8_9AGAR|nr:hypothetical protein BDN70DRAFT_537432 [Pholiota conissans]
MSLAKIPATFFVSLTFQKCITPPHPPPPKSERIQTNSKDVEWYTQTVLPMAAKIQWVIAFSEIATILAYNYPSSNMSKTILSYLVTTEGDPSKLGLSGPIVLGGTMMIIGALIRITTYRYLGRFFRYEASIQKNHQLIVTGPYAIVRHPSYTGFLISHPGWFLWQLSPGSWVRESGLWGNWLGKVLVLTYAHVVIASTVYTVLRRMKAEDEALRDAFGEKWVGWAKEVPYCVVPGVY